MLLNLFWKLISDLRNHFSVFALAAETLLSWINDEFISAHNEVIRSISSLWVALGDSGEKIFSLTFCFLSSCGAASIYSLGQKDVASATTSFTSNLDICCSSSWFVFRLFWLSDGPLRTACVQHGERKRKTCLILFQQGQRIFDNLLTDSFIKIYVK